jgi:hypothetical protein
MYLYMQYGFESFLAFSALCARDGGHRIRTNMHCEKYNISEDRLRSYYRGGALGMVICSTRITVTLSIFNFSTRFFAQIVENREAQLYSLFLGPGDIFFEKL